MEVWACRLLADPSPPRAREPRPRNPFNRDSISQSGHQLLLANADVRHFCARVASFLPPPQNVIVTRAAHSVRKHFSKIVELLLLSLIHRSHLDAMHIKYLPYSRNAFWLLLCFNPTPCNLQLLCDFCIPRTFCFPPRLGYT